MKRPILWLSLLIALVTLMGCGRSGEEATDKFNSELQSESTEIKTSEKPEMQNERDIESLKEQCPEYFELSSFKGIEVYVWKTEDGTYRCGMMSGTNRMKIAPEIQALEQNSLSIAEVKKVLEVIGVGNDEVFIIPVTQPYTSDASDTNISELYVIDEELAEEITKLFAEN